ncbi:polyphosphate kinase 1 [Ohessyouella blattaphilus]|uniref:Polyphosphate kinase n=1 Tax=Ohessyouella blattaphilus TaxID=2949333 RepID=A0ABT1EF35_9FIRM|nr:polyphosphate kinase 1 [Ohessyouella blattaphilus]MCP1109327.1 polyphosphate kinase 1 [Ohessyouella blattaphilus]MCR8562721.1 polyphosphate kinase 1 [Ohessyouella blattaphilus]
MEKYGLPYTQNRELSWLRFNERVLQEGEDEKVPLLERMKFVAIFTSNLDEFFMIRVGSLFDMAHTDETEVDKRSGMTVNEQLGAIYEAVAPLYKERDQTYSKIKKLLHPYGILGLDYNELSGSQKKYVKKDFVENILPILSPQIVDANHPFPHLLNKEIYVTASLTRGNKQRMGIVPVPSYVSDILFLPGEDLSYIRMEKVILENLDLVFENYEVSERNYICVTRNADITPDDESLDITDDFRKLMKKTLGKRQRMAVVRLEIAEKLSSEMEGFFCKQFGITPKQIFRTKMPMKLEYIFGMADKLPEKAKRKLVYTPFAPQNVTGLTEGTMRAQIKKQDLLLHFPYESMNPFLTLIKEASTDPDVLTIKITIYRLAKQARLVEYLSAAAENGKEVTVLIELRARFDEQNNIDWSERLEEAGCRVLYGFEGYKVHSKVCLITYRNRNRIEYITQVGTGNYNEKTATMYTDLSLITAHEGIGEDANNFFKNMGIGNLNGAYDHFIVSPSSLKQHVLFLIDEEIKKGSAGRVIMKMNSLTDLDFIEKVVEASNAGVKIDLQVRGICCLRPGVAGYTDNIRVTSIVGRYLEHPRIFSFGTGRDQKLYLGSADMMTRNTEKRVEVACPVLDEGVKAKINHYLAVMLADNVKIREMKADGTYQKVAQTEPKVSAQSTFMKETLHTAKNTIEVKPKSRKGVFRILERFFRGKDN